MRTHIVNFLIFLCVVSFVSSCAILRPGNHSKQVAYFQNIDTTRMTQSSHDFVARVKPGDKLTITVQSTNIDASVNFNKQLYLNNSINAPSSSIVLSTKSAASADYYLVQPDGTINMPVIGKLNVMDKTTDEIRKIVESKVDPYFTIHDKPLVTVNFQGYKVTVIGEVKAPGDVYTDTERIGLMEAMPVAVILRSMASARMLCLFVRMPTVRKSYILLTLLMLIFLMIPIIIFSRTM